MENPIDGAVLVYVPEGEFLMGSDDEDARDVEKPQRLVYLDLFWIYKNPVTNAEYRMCVEDGVCILPSATRYFRDPDYEKHPVVYVGWSDATTYCEWAGGRLPTEAEWEKAARGTDGRKYPWGDQSPTCNLANFRGCVGTTSPVGSYPMGSSPYGALDMAGNVREWIADWHAADYYSYAPNQNPTGPTTGIYQVQRGGSWDWPETTLLVSRRYSSANGRRDYSLGFRCIFQEAP